MGRPDFSAGIDVVLAHALQEGNAGQWDALATWLDEAISAFPQAVGLYALKARHAMLNKDYAAARQMALHGLAYVKSVDCLRVLEDAYREEGDLAGALCALDVLAQMLPDDSNVPLRQGNAYYELGDYDVALRYFVQSAELNPDSPAPLMNMGFTLKARQDFPGALAAYQEALRRAPGDADTHWNMALLLLLMGRWEEGLHESEWRWQKAVFPTKPRGFVQPLWMGTPVETLLIHAEQGFGDCLQMLRYVPLAAARVKQVVLEIQPELSRLTEHQMGSDLLPPNVRVVIQGNPPLPAFDAHVPMMTLPLALGLVDLGNPPTPEPHLMCQPGIEFKEAEDVDRPLNVGIVWRGRPTFPHNKLRSFGLQDLEPLFAIPGIRWLSLQKTLGVDIADELQQAPVQIIDLGTRAQDFLDTARYLKSLDLFITTDTSVAHLAGALGVETWVAVMVIPDWRWGLTGERCAWYDTIRLFRQTVPGEWEPVFVRMREALVERLAQGRKVGLPP